MSTQEYLEAKLRVDLRSLNRRVFNGFARVLGSLPDARVLDAGTGTGLMIRRLIALRHRGNLELWGVDIDPINCAHSLESVRRAMKTGGFECGEPSGGRLKGTGEGKRLTVRIVCEDFLGSRVPTLCRGKPLDCVTAHAFMDLVPLTVAVRRVSLLLRDGGIFYASVNYDGLTRLFPLYGDRPFEDELIRYYEGTMDRRKKDGRRTGGSRTGSLLFNAVVEGGFDVIDFGSSDWQIFPRNGRYAAGEKSFLEYLLGFIVKENRANPRVGAGRLEAWHAERRNDIEGGRLALITHQTDLLAVKKSGAQGKTGTHGARRE